MTETTNAAAIFAPLWRRKWLILAVGLLVGAGAYVYYKRKTPVYSVTTQVYLGSGAEEQAQLSAGGSTVKKATSPEAATQVVIINSNLVKEAVHQQLRRERTKTQGAKAALKGKSKAKALAEKSEFIAITAEASSPRGAALLANTTALVYIARENAKYQAEVEAAIRLARRQLHRIEAAQAVAASGQKAAAGTSGSSASKAATSTTVTIQAATLSSKINELEQDLAVVNVKQVNPAKPAEAVLVSPLTRQNAIFGFVLGILLASFAAYALGRMDRRLRSLAEIEAAFQAQILTALRLVRRPIIRRDGRPTPSAPLRESLRRLHTNLQVGNLLGNDEPRQPRVLLFVSPESGDGKSTVVADLALCQRDAGARVAIIEADLRRPVQARLLGLAGPQGLPDVLAGTVPVAEAMQRVEPLGVAADGQAAAGAGGVATVLEASGTGGVSVLVGSAGVANPPALLAGAAMTELLRAVAEDYDYVLVDAPAPLEVSDVIPLLDRVDGIVAVARVGHTSEVSARRLVQLLERTPSAPLLGVVANAVSPRDMEKNGFSSAYAEGRRRRKLLG